MNNLKQKNTLFKLAPDNGLPYSDNEYVDFKNSSELNSPVINKSMNELLENDLYIENYLNNTSSYMQGPKVYDEATIANMPNGYKAFGNLAEADCLDILHKVETPLADTITKVLNIKNVKFICQYNNIYFVGSSSEFIRYAEDPLNGPWSILPGSVKAVDYFQDSNCLLFAGSDGVYQLSIDVDIRMVDDSGNPNLNYGIKNYSAVKLNKTSMANVTAVVYSHKNKRLIVTAKSTDNSNKIAYLTSYNATNITPNKLSFDKMTSFDRNEVSYNTIYNDGNYIDSNGKMLLAANSGLFFEKQKFLLSNRDILLINDGHEYVSYNLTITFNKRLYIATDKGLYYKNNDVLVCAIADFDCTSVVCNNISLYAVGKSSDDKAKVYSIDTNFAVTDNSTKFINYSYIQSKALNKVCLFNNTVVLATSSGCYYFTPDNRQMLNRFEVDGFKTVNIVDVCSTEKAILIASSNKVAILNRITAYDIQTDYPNSLDNVKIGNHVISEKVIKVLKLKNIEFAILDKGVVNLNSLTFGITPICSSTETITDAIVTDFDNTPTLIISTTGKAYFCTLNVSNALNINNSEIIYGTGLNSTVKILDNGNNLIFNKQTQIAVINKNSQEDISLFDVSSKDINVLDGKLYNIGSDNNIYGYEFARSMAKSSYLDDKTIKDIDYIQENTAGIMAMIIDNKLSLDCISTDVDHEHSIFVETSKKISNNDVNDIMLYETDDILYLFSAEDKLRYISSDLNSDSKTAYLQLTSNSRIVCIDEPTNCLTDIEIEGNEIIFAGTDNKMYYSNSTPAAVNLTKTSIVKGKICVTEFVDTFTDDEEKYKNYIVSCDSTEIAPGNGVIYEITGKTVTVYWQNLAQLQTNILKSTISQYYINNDPDEQYNFPSNLVDVICYTPEDQDKLAIDGDVHVPYIAFFADSNYIYRKDYDCEDDEDISMHTDTKRVLQISDVVVNVDLQYDNYAIGSGSNPYMLIAGETGITLAELKTADQFELTNSMRFDKAALGLKTTEKIVKAYFHNNYQIYILTSERLLSVLLSKTYIIQQTSVIYDENNYSNIQYFGKSHSKHSNSSILICNSGNLYSEQTGRTVAYGYKGDIKYVFYDPSLANYDEKVKEIVYTYICTTERMYKAIKPLITDFKACINDVHVKSIVSLNGDIFFINNSNYLCKVTDIANILAGSLASYKILGTHIQFIQCRTDGTHLYCITSDNKIYKINEFDDLENITLEYSLSNSSYKFNDIIFTKSKFEYCEDDASIHNVINLYFNDITHSDTLLIGNSSTKGLMYFSGTYSMINFTNSMTAMDASKFLNSEKHFMILCTDNKTISKFNKDTGYYEEKYKADDALLDAFYYDLNDELYIKRSNSHWYFGKDFNPDIWMPLNANGYRIDINSMYSSQAGKFACANSGLYKIVNYVNKGLTYDILTKSYAVKSLNSNGNDTVNLICNSNNEVKIVNAKINSNSDCVFKELKYNANIPMTITTDENTTLSSVNVLMKLADAWYVDNNQSKMMYCELIDNEDELRKKYENDNTKLDLSLLYCLNYALGNNLNYYIDVDFNDIKHIGKHNNTTYLCYENGIEMFTGYKNIYGLFKVDGSCGSAYHKVIKSKDGKCIVNSTESIESFDGEDATELKTFSSDSITTYLYDNSEYRYVANDGKTLKMSDNCKRWKDIFTLKNDIGTIADIYVRDKYTYFFSTDTGLFSTRYAYKMVNDVKAFTLNDALSLYEECMRLPNVGISAQVSSTLSSHVNVEHLSSSMISRLNADYLNTSMEDILTEWQNTVVDSNDSLAIKNDIIAEMYFGKWADGDINVSVVNFLSTEETPFIEPTDITYIMKRWMSGITELYINIPTTNTYYIANVFGASNCSRSIDESYARQNLSEFEEDKREQSSNLSEHSTEIVVGIASAEYFIDNLLDIQINGNSLPLRIYKDTTSTSIASLMYSSFIEPSVVKSYNVSTTDDDGNYIFKFSCFGSDALAIRLMFYDRKSRSGQPWIKVIFDANGGDGEMAKQKFLINSDGTLDLKNLKKNKFKCEGKIFNGWSLTPLADNYTWDENEGSYDGTQVYPGGSIWPHSTTVSELMTELMRSQDENFEKKEEITLYATWITYLFTDADTTLLLDSNKSDFYINSVDIDANTKLKNNVVINFGD